MIIRDMRGRSVLVIRTPNTCGECEIMYEDKFGVRQSNCFCPAHEEGDGEYAYAQVSRFTRPSWCPLIDLDCRLQEPMLYDYMDNVANWSEVYGRYTRKTLEEDT